MRRGITGSEGGVQSARAIVNRLLREAWDLGRRRGVSCALSASTAPCVLFVGSAEDLRRGQISFIIFSTNHKDAVCINWNGRASIACSVHTWPHLELHRLEIKNLYVISDVHVIIYALSDEVSPRS